MIFYLLIIIVLISLYILFLTPYPFVWLLRSKKSKEDKTPDLIKTIKKDLIIKENLKYKSLYPRSNFTLYYNPNLEIKKLIVWVHGGSFVAGDNSGVRNFAMMLANKGYAVCAINYAHAPRFSFPTQIKQLDESLYYLKIFLEKELKTSLKEVVLGGDSAGANIVSNYACMINDNNLANKSKVIIKNELKINSLLLFCGPYDFNEDFNSEAFKDFIKFFNYIGWSYFGKKNWLKDEKRYLASPLYHINKDFFPTYLVDGKKYSFLWQAKKLAEVLKDKDIIVKTRFYDHVPHEFQFNYVKYPQEAMEVFNDTINFLEIIE